MTRSAAPTLTLFLLLGAGVATPRVGRAAAVQLADGTTIECHRGRCEASGPGARKEVAEAIRGGAASATALLRVGRDALVVFPSLGPISVVSLERGLPERAPESKRWRSVASGLGLSRVNAAARWGGAGYVLFGPEGWAVVAAGSLRADGPHAWKTFPGSLPEVLPEGPSSAFGLPRNRLQLSDSKTTLTYDIASKRHEVVESKAATVSAAEPTEGLALGAEPGPPIFTIDREGHLASVREGLVSFELRADWDDAHCAKLRRSGGQARKYIYAHGSERQARFKVALDCDRKRLHLEGGGTTDSTVLRPGLTKRRFHHVVLETDAHGTVVWLDGRAVATLPVVYADLRRVPAYVGSNTGGAAPFIGVIKSLRIWGPGTSVETVEGLKGLSPAALERSEAYRALIGQLVETSRGWTLQTKRVSFDPSGVWTPTARANEPQVRTSRGDKFTYRPVTVHSVEWTGRCSKLAKLGGASGAGDCDGKVLAVLSSNLQDPPRIRAFERKSEVRFAGIGSSSTLTIDPDSSRLKLDGDWLSKPVSTQEEYSFTAKWGAEGGVPGYKVINQGWDLRSMNLRAPHLEKANGRWLFAMGPAEVGKNWTTEGGKPLPWGLQIDQSINRCDGKASTSESSSESTLANTLGTSVSEFNAVIGTNRDFEKERSTRSTNKEVLMRSEVRCRQYGLMLDPARAKIAQSFRDKVERLRRAGLDGACANKIAGVCEAALAKFIEGVGTHYANGMVFGALLRREASIDGRTYSWAEQTAKKSGRTFDMNIDLSVKTGVSLGVSTEVSMGTSLKFKRDNQKSEKQNLSKLQSDLNQQSSWYSIGGRGGADFSNWTESEDVLPIYIDIHRMHELLSPPFFTQAEVITTLRTAVEVYLRDHVLKTGELSDRAWFATVRGPGSACEDNSTCFLGQQCRKSGGQRRCLYPKRSVNRGGQCTTEDECKKRLMCKKKGRSKVCHAKPKPPPASANALRYHDHVSIKATARRWPGHAGYLSPCGSDGVCGAGVSLRPDAQFHQHEPNSNLRRWKLEGGARGTPIRYGDVVQLKATATRWAGHAGYLSPCGPAGPWGVGVSLRPDSEFHKHEPRSNLRSWTIRGGRKGQPVKDGAIVQLWAMASRWAGHTGYLSPAGSDGACGVGTTLRPDSQFKIHEPNSNLRNWKLKRQR